MKNIKDKIVSVICAAAICAPAAVIPAAAETTNTWKFDFGAGTPADGYLAVSADMVYDMSDTESFQYGFLGTTETSYADDVLGYTFDQRAIDGYTVSKGQYITLTEGGTQSDSDPDTDYIAVPKKADYMPEGASEYEGRYPLRFSVKAENGGYYTVTVTLANSSDTEEARVSLYSEKRHIIAQDAVLEPGERAEFTFNVDIENVFYKDYSKSYPDDILNISVVGENAAISSMIVEEHAKVDGTINGTSAQVNDGVTLWACDDSTGCDCPSTIPVFPLQNYAGVAQALSKYMPESIAVSNQGERGLASGDNAHFNNCLLKEGDYLYVEYGHNESSGDSYKSNLEKYYTRAHEAGAKLIIVSPVERHNKWSDGSWQSSLSGYAEKGSEFVEEKIAAGADDIAFVDLNTRYLAWMNEETARIGAINSDVAGQSAICYYYQSAKGESVDGTHVNDAGADQAAYCFFEEAADTVAAAAQDDASESTKLQAAVLEPIVSGMKTKIGSTDADNLPLTVSDEIILAGSAPNSYWDTPVKDSVTYTNSAAVCATDYTQNEDGSRTLSGISIRLMNTLVYAKAVVTVESDGESTVYYSESNFDCTGDATGSVKTISGFISSDKDHTAVTDADKVSEITIPAGAKCTIEIVSCDDNWVVGSDFVSYSTKYTLPDVDKDILTEDFSDVSDWTYSGGVGYHSETVKTDSDNTSYLAIESSGVGTDGTTKKNYAFYRALDEGVSDGVLRISLKARYSAGMIRFALANEVSTSASNPLPVKAYTAWLYNSKAYSISDEYGVTTSVDTSNPYLINAGEWLDIDCIYDIDNGKEYLSVGGSDYLVTEISELSQNEVPSTLPFNYFAIAGDSQGTGLYADVKDLTVSKLNADELADIAVSASANDSSMGSVTINGEAVSETTVKMNSSVTLRAKAADEDHTFVNWTDENGEETSTLSSLTISRVHNPVSLTANFRALEADEPRTKTWDFSEFTDDTASTGETTTDYDGLEIHTNSGDTVGLSGVYWSAPGGTKSDSTTVVSNNRYIKYTAPKDGQMTITYKGSYNTSRNHPRMYVSCGSDTSCMTKDASSGQSEANQQYDNNAADTLATMTVSLTGGMTYYIWGYFYNNTSCAFTITDMTYTADTAQMTTRNIYESNMLLQRDKPVYIDGTCTTVVKEATAQLINETSGETVQTKAVDIDGKEWSLTFDPVSDYTNTYTLRISSDGMDDLVYTNIIFGDQYLFSGQSNMWKSVVYYRSKDSDYAQATVEEHLSDKIRVMYSKGSSCYGKTDPCYDEPYKSSWRDFSTYSNVSELPAVAFTAAVQLYENTGVPIGVIANAYPGSYISCWFPNTGIDACNSNKNGNSNERNWYNGRIYPIRNLKLSGIFWYQGEADSSDAYHSPQYDYYKEMMTQLINDWRELFGDDTLPFYYVQLCRLGQTVDENNSDTTSDGEIFIRRAQTDVYVEAEDKTNIGIVGTLDIYGNYTYAETSNDANCRNDIHPAQKRLIGERLAAYALKDIYGKDVDTHGPIYQSVKSDGGSLVITYDCTGKLSVMPSESYGDEVSAQKIENGEYDPNVLNEFEVAGADGVWYAADAEITSDNQVTVHSDSVPKPISVRYAYSSYPESPNLTDDTGLPSYVFMSECEIGDITYADNTLTIPADLTAVSGIDADVYVAEYSSDGTLAAVKKAELAEDGTTISYSLKDESNSLAVMIWDNNMLSFTQKAIMQ